MTNLINDAQFNFCAEDLTDLQAIIHELVFNHPDLRQCHDIEEGISFNKQIVFAGAIGLLGKKKVGCTPNPVDGITLSDKFWSPCDLDFRLEHCHADASRQNKLINQMSKLNPDFYNIVEGSNAGVGAFLIAKVLEAMQENLPRQIWFSDTAADVLPAGSLTAGTDVDYFNTIDGLWKQIFTNIPITSELYVEMPRNAGATFADQALQPGDAQQVLKDMTLAADSRLLDHPDAKFYVSRSVYEAYRGDLEDKLCQNGFIERTENGSPSLSYGGYPVVMHASWDRNIKAYFNNGTVYDKPNRALFTIPSNVPIGTVAESDFGTVEAFYNQYHKVNVIDGIYGLDVKHLENYLTVASY